jgi:hypothetical protein
MSIRDMLMSRKPPARKGFSGHLHSGWCSQIATGGAGHVEAAEKLGLEHGEHRQAVVRPGQLVLPAVAERDARPEDQVLDDP